MEYVVNLKWDMDSFVWIATSEDIKGLVLESGSFDALIERVRFAVPEILLLNKSQVGEKISLCFRSERYEQAYA